MTDNELEQARRAIRLERAVGARRVPVRVREVDAAGDGVARLVVDADEPLRASEHVGGRLSRRLEDGGEGPTWTAHVLEVEEDGATLWAAVSPQGTPPDVGAASLWPVDMLAAPDRLLNSAPTAPWMRRLSDALRWARGDDGLEIEVEGPAGLAPEWGHDRVLVWGPPGTGKTHTIAQQVRRLLDDPLERVLIVSTTNRAVDDLLLRLFAVAGPHGAALRRVGGGADVERYLQQEAMGVLPPVESPEHVVSLQRELAASRGRARAIARTQLAVSGLPRLQLASELRDARWRVLACTVHAAAAAVVHPDVLPMLGAGEAPFSTLVIDEAGMVSRLLTAALTLLASRRVVLVGDPRQLSPVARATRSMPAEVATWVAASGLQHLHAGAPGPAIQRLTTQRRMHPDIRRAVSQFAYGGALIDAQEVSDRRWGDPALRRLPRAMWYVLDEAGLRPQDLGAERGPGGASRQRAAVKRVLGALFDAHPSLRTLRGRFVSPFRAQVALVARELDRLGAATWTSSTVHAQQGAEADVVVFDTVHLSSTGWSPQEWVRLINVGMSRARELLIVVASRAEMDQPVVRDLPGLLAPRVLRHREWVEVDRVKAQALWPAPSTEAAPAAAPVAAEGGPPALQPSSHRLGAQLSSRRAMRAVLSRDQAMLVHRDLSDAGPRLVRGVAGSGKSLVLAHWAVRCLQGRGVPRVAVVYANRSLGSLLQRMVEEAWRDGSRAGTPVPWERFSFLFLADLLQELCRERGLPVPVGQERWEYEATAAGILANGPGDGRFPALFIDEAQDFGHEALRLLIELTAAAEDGSRAVMVFYDNAQNVYGRRPPRWSELGIDLRGRSDVMKEAFRTTRQNTEFALEVLHGLRDLRQDPDLRELMRMEPPLLWEADGRWRVGFCPAEGQAPQVRLLGDRKEELRVVTDQVVKWISVDGVRPGDIRVLAVGEDVRADLTEALRRALDGSCAVRARRSEGYDGCDDAVVVTTPHSFKGHDAEVVIVAGVDRFRADGEVLYAPLYVALTRARTLLLVTGTLAGSDGAAKRLVSAVLQAAERHGASTGPEASLSRAAARPGSG